MSTITPPTIRPGSLADAPALAAFGEQTFRDAFGAQNSAADLELYLAHAYGERQQAAELRHPAITTLLAEAEAQLAGYAQLRPGTRPPCVTGPAPLELWRFYIDPAWQGRGVAQVLMEAVLAAAVASGRGTVWLAVWEHNPRAQAFYGKCGFVDVGQEPFVLGTDPQTDRVMQRILTPAARPG